VAFGESEGKVAGARMTGYAPSEWLPWLCEKWVIIVLTSSLVHNVRCEDPRKRI
jgi:hypothetical protein